MKTRLMPLLATAAVAMLTLSACGTTAPLPAVSVTVSPTAEPGRGAVPAPPENLAPEVVWPLTGVDAADADPALFARPSLAVKIENPAEVRPQVGLEKADVVWETVIEGGITRFIAVFHSDVPEEVGPVRSVRPMDGPIVGYTNGILAFSGGIADFIQIARNSGLSPVSQDTGNSGFFRAPGRAAPHNLHGDTETIYEQAPDGLLPPRQEFQFAYPADQATAVVVGEAKSSIDVRMSGYSNPVWTWGEAEGKWLRSERTADAVDPEGNRLVADNVVALLVPIQNTKFVDPSGTAVPETVIVGSGQGWVATGGKVIEIEWSKKDVGSPMVFTTLDGQPVLLAPGKTWIELASASSGSVTLR